MTVNPTFLHPENLSIHLLTVPERNRYLPNLLAGIDDNYPVKIWIDEEHQGVWWNAQRAWQDGVESGATHIMVLQDDIRLCRNFIQGIERIIAIKPNDIVSLHHTFKIPDSQSGWIKSNSMRNAQALLMPNKIVKQWLAWNKEHIKINEAYDDQRLEAFVCFNQQMIWYPKRTLVQHQQVNSILRSNIPGNAIKSRNVSNIDASELNFIEGVEEPLVLHSHFSKPDIRLIMQTISIADSQNMALRYRSNFQ